MYIKNQKFLVLGVSKSGYACADYLLNNGVNCYLYEDLKSEKINNSINELCSRGAIKVEKEEIKQVINYIDIVVISPGVPINNEVAVLAKENGKRIMGEFEFAYSVFMPTFIGVTGTNGKTTTVSLINAILQENGSDSMLVGNCGVPLSSKINDVKSETICVAEVSSYQLESISSFCPHIACVINISPDHLERHYTMDNYIFLKKRIFQNQKESEFAILNYDDEVVKNFGQYIRSKAIYVSLNEKVIGGYRLDGKLYYNNEYIMDEIDLSLKGNHNVLDVLFAICSAKLLGIKNEVIVKALKEFKGVRHRIEFVCEKGGIKYFNDSKATNTASTISAIDTMITPTILILGGSEKGEDYQNLFNKIKNSNVKHVVICGASKVNMIRDAFKANFLNFSVINDFNVAIKFCQMIASNGDNVLLSPACASFDNFSSFEERGDAFCKQVQLLNY